MKIHKLKTLTEYFDEVQNGVKSFEIRKDDRGFKVGDRLELMEYNQESGSLTGRFCQRRITYILSGGQFGLEKGYIAMGIEPV